MKKRAAETLVEILTAMLVFGITIGFVSDFIANQTLVVARAKIRERIIYSAQKWINSGIYTTSRDNELNIDREWNDETKTLKVTSGATSMTFKLN